MSPRVLRILRHIAHLEPHELTACGPVWLGTENCREILAALDDADTLKRARELLASGVAPHTVAILLAAPTTETVDLRPAHAPRLDR